jgi:hypothetical protein
MYEGAEETVPHLIPETPRGRTPGIQPPPKTPVHLWIVGVLALLWNAFGAFDFTATQIQLDGYMKQFTPAQLDYFYGFPLWVTIAWALGVWGAFLGSVLLLFRCRWAVHLFGASLVGLAVSSVYNFGLSNGIEIMGTVGVVITLVIWVIAILLLYYSMRQVKRGVLT